jgi:putative transposase
LPSLRQHDEFEVLRFVFEEALEREDFRIVQFSVQTNHVHYICEARDKESLTRGMQSLGVKIARRLNQLWERAGRVFAERYHARALETPHEVRTALAYVLNNARKHGLGFIGADPYSSGESFDGWSEESAPFSNAPRDRGRVSSTGTSTTAPRFTRTVDCTTAAAQSWLMRVGWRRHGLIHVHEIPGAGSATRTRLEAEARLADSIQRSSAAAAHRALGRARISGAMEAWG